MVGGWATLMMVGTLTMVGDIFAHAYLAKCVDMGVENA